MREIGNRFRAAAHVLVGRPTMYGVRLRPITTKRGLAVDLSGNTGGIFVGNVVQQPGPTNQG